MEEGITLDLNNSRASGCFGQIFLVDGWVYKLFHREGNATEYARRRTFEAERGAYEIAMKAPELRKHIPTFFGTAIVKRVLDSKRAPAVDRSADYLLDCCLVMDFVDGTPRKYNDLTKDFPALREVARKFLDHGIEYVTDSSVFNWANAATAKFIDFAVERIEPNLDRKTP